MAIGVSALSPSAYGVTPGSGAAAQNPAGVPLGLRGAVSLGSGLRTGVTVVDHAIRFSSELGEARERAREAQQEAARLEAELAEAEAAARRDELRSEAEDGASSSTASSLSASSLSASSPSASSGSPEESTRQTIVAAVAAGQSGEEPPRGAFVDFSV